MKIAETVSTGHVVAKCIIRGYQPDFEALQRAGYIKRSTAFLDSYHVVDFDRVDLTFLHPLNTPSKPLAYRLGLWVRNLIRRLYGRNKILK